MPLVTPSQDLFTRHAGSPSSSEFPNLLQEALGFISTFLGTDLSLRHLRQLRDDLPVTRDGHRFAFLDAGQYFVQLLPKLGQRDHASTFNAFGNHYLAPNLVSLTAYPEPLLVAALSPLLRHRSSMRCREEQRRTSRRKGTKP